MSAEKDGMDKERWCVCECECGLLVGNDLEGDAERGPTFEANPPPVIGCKEGKTDTFEELEKGIPSVMLDILLPPVPSSPADPGYESTECPGPGLVGDAPPDPEPAGWEVVMLEENRDFFPPRDQEPDPNRLGPSPG